MTAAPTQEPATDKPKRTRRKDAYVAILTVKIPLDMTNADSLANAIKAIQGIEATLPAGSTVDGFGNAKLGKL